MSGRGVSGVQWAALSVIGLCAAFAAIAAYVASGQTLPLERAMLLSVRERSDPSRMLGPRWLPEMLRDVTSLGSIVVLWLIIVVLGGYLALARKWADLAFLGAATIGGQIASTATKHLLDRARPDFIPDAPMVFTASFPSGHALLSAVTYLTIGALLAEREPRRRLRVLYIAIAIALTILIGLSRIALGVHWPTDVMGGWCVGTAWAVLCATVVRHLRSDRRSDPIL